MRLIMEKNYKVNQVKTAVCQGASCNGKEQRTIRRTETISKTDYGQYRYKRQEWVTYFGRYLALSAVLAFLFYRSIWGMWIAAVLVPAGMRRSRKRLLDGRRHRLLLQFKDSMRLVSESLQAGYSMENAWMDAQKDMIAMHGTDADMCIELAYMNQQLHLQEPIERLLLDFARRSGLEDAKDFGEIFVFAKRSGGNLIEIIRHTIKRINDKTEVMEEIETVLAEKRLEQKIMNVMPLLILLYIRFSAPEFIEPLYGNVVGVIVMTGCLFVYGISFIVSEKLVDIEV